MAWADGELVARHVERLGAVELAVRPLKEAAPALVREALKEGLRREGFGLLRWSREAGELRERLAFLHRTLGAPWPDVSDDALHARVDEWLEPELGKARRRSDLGRIDAGQALRRLLPGRAVTRPASTSSPRSGWRYRAGPGSGSTTRTPNSPCWP